MNNQTDAQDNQNQPCDACGCSAEMGFIIKENDEVATVSIQGENEDLMKAHLEEYINLANQVNPRVVHQIVESTPQSLTAHLQFECSAEKLIFELKSRSLQTA